MDDRQNLAAQRAHRLFRQETQKREGEVAWKEYTAQEEATRRQTAKLKALRLARDAAAPAAATSAKVAKKAALPGE